jgi:hypothetical protein
MTQTAQYAPTRQKLLEKALEEISIGDPEKAEVYIELALAEETAAPEMLEALEDLLAHAEYFCPQDLGLKVYEQARAAIAKAKGGAA